MASESTVQRQIWLSLGRISKLFRLNTGRAWLSNMGPRGVQKLADGSVLIKSARSIALGLSSPNGEPVVGACDLPGWTPVVITEDMVGRTVAVFTSIETKASGGGEVREKQRDWMAAVQRDGGIAGIANSPAAAEKIIREFIEQKRLTV